ncbi:protein YgfX [Chromobacterium sp. IIBBL 290-4]|uniref:protein YgfX n=1 Tax=Chromobacterium sp. IIBBL 290-4 TaxID=2953890 RepID=UPI0020B889CF|nr:protein YgfX [Chromobacterium sp. IIBBL 290-4]UTH73245.1 hypothetical protein NKT35_17150 [Chromobacterium sp. IIBBL 290-4]
MKDGKALLQPFALTLRRSRLWLCLVSAALLAGSAVVLLYLHASYAMILPAAVLFAWRALRADGWAGAAAPDRLEVDPQGRLFWCEGALRQQVEARGDCFVTPLLTVLNVDAEGGRRSVMLWPDSADAEARRQLRVYLLWFHSPQRTESKESA